MKDNMCLHVAKFFRVIIRWLLLSLTTLIFIFALLSGSEDYGGGWTGIINNSPNALPWLLLYMINIIVWKYELWGGILLIIFALASGYFFNAFQGNYIVLLVICMPLFIMGLLLLFYHSCKEKRGYN